LEDLEHVIVRAVPVHNQLWHQADHKPYWDSILSEFRVHERLFTLMRVVIKDT